MAREQNLVEKIAQQYALDLPDNYSVQSGDYLMIKPQHVMTHDNTGAVIPKFKSIGATKIADCRQPVFTLDHNVQNKSDENLAKYEKIEAFAKQMGVDFYPAGRGIGHQIMVEEGYAWPGTMMIASDSHSNTYGGIGCLGTPIVRTDAAAIWATGRTWWQVPPVARVELRGKLRSGVTGKDLIVTLCGFFNKDEVLNHAIEFAGDGIAALSVDERLTVANMTTEWGALVGLFPIDAVTIEWLEQRIAFVEARGLEGVPSDIDGVNSAHPRMNRLRLSNTDCQSLSADKGAFYAKELTIDLDTIVPHVSGPNSVKVMAPVSVMRDKKIAISKAYLVSCVNARVQDIAEAAAIAKGGQVAGGVEFYIGAASSEVQKVSERRGDWQTLLDAGAIALPPGCGPCIGLGVGLLEDGEVGISATNRNFKGRMGSKEAEAYLASPAVVAASALAGFITMPEFFDDIKTTGTCRVHRRTEEGSTTAGIIDGFPRSIKGRLIFCTQDNLNTDGIYPGKYTYLDDFTPEQQAAVVMENYDPDFGKQVAEGDVLIGGFNFGTGSSREQAATALKYRGIQLVLAGSFSETYKRNAINNGFLAIEAPELVHDLRARYGTNNLTIFCDSEVSVDFIGSVIEFDGKTYSMGALGTAAQELIAADGLENWVKERL